MILPKCDKKERKGLTLTPKKSKGKSSNPSPSLAAVRSPSFKLLGSITLSQKNASKKGIVLNNFESGCCLSGWLDIHCDVAAELPQDLIDNKKATMSRDMARQMHNEMRVGSPTKKDSARPSALREVLNSKRSH